MGKRKVFTRLHVYERLEELRIGIINKAATLIQSIWRRHCDRRRFLRKRGAALVLQRFFRGRRLRLKFLQMHRAAIVIQSHLRGMFAREVNPIKNSIF